MVTKKKLVEKYIQIIPLSLSLTGIPLNHPHIVNMINLYNHYNISSIPKKWHLLIAPYGGGGRKPHYWG